MCYKDQKEQNILVQEEQEEEEEERGYKSAISSISKDKEKTKSN